MEMAIGICEEFPSISVLYDELMATKEDCYSCLSRVIYKVKGITPKPIGKAQKNKIGNFFTSIDYASKNRRSKK